MPTETTLSAWSVILTGSLTDETALVQRLVAEAALDAPPAPPSWRRGPTW